MRYIWSGAITFGLIHIPIRLYTAARDRPLHFHYMRRNDLCPISYAKVCRRTGAEVSKDEMVKAFEYRKGEYVILEDEDFEKAAPEKTHNIEVTEFIDEKEVDFKYIEKPYYTEPTADAKKVYALLRETMRKTGKAGICRLVLKNREHLALLKPHEPFIMLYQLRFDNEIVRPENPNPPEARAVASERELALAVQLVEQLSGTFHPEHYSDTYTEELRKIIEEKAQGRKRPAIRAQPPPLTPAPDLLARLKESLKANQDKKQEEILVK